VRGEQAAGVVGEVPVDHLRHTGAEDDAEAGAADVPADHIRGVRVEAAAGVDDLRPGEAQPGGAAVPGHDDGRGPVAEEAARDDVGHRVVPGLHRERTELDREQHSDLLGMPGQIVVHAGQPGRARDTAQSEARQAFDVGAHPEPLDQLGVDGGRGDVPVTEVKSR